jgi:hypothetical protein
MPSYHAEFPEDMSSLA